MPRIVIPLVVALCCTTAARAGEGPIERLAFGSCAHQDKPQPIWDAVLAAKPQLFLMIGDAVYHDVIVDKLRKNDTLAQKYGHLDAQPGFAKLRKMCPLLGTWDDHDYGLNDAGAEYLKKNESQKAWLDFLGVPADSPRRAREGVYHAEIFGPPERSVQVILLDTRYFRGPLKKRPKFIPSEGPYEPSADASSTMLGAAQWQWLEEQLKKPAKVRILASSIQVVAQDHHHEKWHNLPHERERLYKLIHDTGAAGVVCLSGDRHLAELSMMDAGIGYPLYDLTSSGLTQAFMKWRKQEVNRHRVMTMNVGNNFGMIVIDWSRPVPLVALQIRDQAGDVTIQEKVPLSVLQPGTIRTKPPALAKINGRAITPELIKELLKQEVTLEMEVQATGTGGGLIFLNSAEDFKNQDNFTVVLDKKAQAALKQAGVETLRTHYDGKTIRVVGVLSLFRETPQIVVSDPKQIHVTK